MPSHAWITLLVGLLAVVGVILTVDQRTRADNRASTPFIARTDRDTLQALADCAVTVAGTDLAETEHTSDIGPHSAYKEQS